MKKYIGIFSALASAFIFGFTPVLAKLSYDGGSNGINLTFFRAVLALPVLLIILKILRIPLILTRQQFRDLISVGILGPCATTLLLYSSYEYIPVGMATVIHFLYPMIVTVASALLFKTRLSRSLVISVVLATSGIALFFNLPTAISWTGVTLAALSSVSYAVYMLGVAETSLKELHFLKLSFYFCAISAIVSGIFGGIKGALTLDMSLSAGVYSFLVSMLVSIGAISLFQLGILLVGAPTTAVMSTLEPITGVLCGILFLNEHLSWGTVLGSILITVGVVVVTFDKIRESRLSQQNQ